MPKSPIAIPAPHAVDSDYDVMVPDPVVRKEFGDVCEVTLDRWTRDPKLSFPPKLKIRGHNYRSRAALEEFKRRLLDAAIRDRKRLHAKA